LAKIKSITFKPQNEWVIWCESYQNARFGAVVEYLDAQENEVLPRIGTSMERTENVADVAYGDTSKLNT
jgi:polyribonucleotide nucleotidyltransferase